MGLLTAFLLGCLIQIHALVARASVDTLVITDIDDTLKIAHVLDKVSAASYAFRTDERFYGMNQLIRDIQKASLSSQVVYLSNAPAWLMSSTHRKFLQKGQFPLGRYIPRNDLTTRQHKLRHIRGLITELQPLQLILIGDNGERDVQIYQQIKNEFANLPVFQFIRILYNSQSQKEPGQSLSEGQIGFVSPLEIAFELHQRQLISEDSLSALVANVAWKAVEEVSWSRDDLIFPDFMRCLDYRWQWDEFLSLTPWVDVYRREILHRCERHTAAGDL